MANAVITRLNNTTGLQLGGAWSGNVAPVSTDAAYFNGITSANPVSANSTNLNWGAVYTGTGQTTYYGIGNGSGVTGSTLTLNGTTAGGTFSTATGIYHNPGNTAGFQVNTNNFVINNTQQWYVKPGSFIDMISTMSGSGTIDFVGGGGFAVYGANNFAGIWNLKSARFVGTNSIPTNPFGTTSATININATDVGDVVTFTEWTKGSSWSSATPMNVNSNFSTHQDAGDAGTYTFSGPINWGGTQRTITNAGSVTFTGAQSGTAGLRKAGGGWLRFTGSSPNLTGTITNSQGEFFIGGTFNANGPSSNVFPNATGLDVSNGSFWFLNSNNPGFTVTAPVTGTGGVIVSQVDTATSAANAVRFEDLSGFTGTLHLWSNQLAANFRSHVVAKKLPTSTAGLYFTIGAGANVTGAQKTLTIPSDAVGHTTGALISIWTDNRQFTNTNILYAVYANQATGAMTFTSPVTRNDGGSGTNNLGTQTLTLGGTNTESNTISGVISSTATSGALAMSKVDAGRWVLSGANTYTGGTGVSTGPLQARHNTAFGTGAVTVSSGGSAEIGNNVTVANALTISGTGVSSAGALRAMDGANTFSGTVATAAAASIGADAGATLTVSNLVSGANDVATTGNGTVKLTGTASTFSGKFTAGAAVTEISSVANASAASSIGTGGLIEVGANDALRYVGSSSTASNRWLSMVGGSGSATHKFENTGTGAVQFLRSSTDQQFFIDPNVNRTLELDGTHAGADYSTGSRIDVRLFDPTGGTTSITKSGTGTWWMSNDTLNTGPTEVNAGTLGGYHDVTTPRPRLGGGNVRLNAGGAIRTATGTSQMGRMTYLSGLKLNGGTLNIGGA